MKSLIIFNICCFGNCFEKLSVSSATLEKQACYQTWFGFITLASRTTQAMLQKSHAHCSLEISD
jgi:hypothetical protein